jgi:pyridoxal phosphate-dependent aminotransferase EpsN
MSGREARYVQEAFAQNWLSTVGPNLNALEEHFTKLVGLPSVALVSGTAAIHLALRLLGLRPGDEVVLPTLTFVASCNPILYERGVPALLDSERGSWNLDPQLLADVLKKRAAVNRLPKAVMAVHLFGQSADLDPILETCRRYELPLIEDAAESLGALYKGRHTGTLGDIGIYSFNGNKIITSTGGGMLVSPREDWVERARHWATQACDKDPLGLSNYLHSELGFNYRLSNVLAGIARGQLEVLEERVQRRRAIFARYCEAFAKVPGIEPQPEATFGTTGQRDDGTTGQLGRARRPSAGGGRPVVQPSGGPVVGLSCSPGAAGSSRHTRWLSCFLIDEAKFGLSAAELIRFLDAANIEARPVWKPMHMQKLYGDCECVGGAVAEDLHRRGLCLPSSSNLSEEEQQFVIERVREARQRSWR